MKREKLSEAMDYISDKHITEAANKKKRTSIGWISSAAAVLAVVIFGLTILKPFAVVKAVSEADYPKYEWEYRGKQMEQELPLLTPFFCQSMAQTLSGSDENQTYSPINLYMALCLMAETSDSNQQILSLLHADSREDLRQQANLIWNATYYDKGDHTLLANSVWLDKGLDYNQEVMDTLAESYYTDVYNGNLQSDRIGSAIKNWLNSNTGNMLRSDVDRLDVDDLTVMLLYSTVFFKAKWSESVEFNKAMNTDGKFHAPGGDVDCTYMNKKEMQTNYYWAEDFGAINLNMKDGSQMWLLLPDEDKTTDDVLSSSELKSMLFGYPSEEEYTNKKYVKVNLKLPKFDIRSGGDLKEDLQAMGVTDVFSSETADFSGTLYGHKDFGDNFSPYFSAVNQATRVAIDEKGVTAASYIELPAAGAAQPPDEIIDFIIDRPFVFVVTNRYDLPLFAGVVNEP